MAVKSTLDAFGRRSGLYANPTKTDIYFGGVNGSIKQAILHHTGFVERQFLFRYLGLPLNSSRVAADMYGSLLQKIQHSVLHWTSKLLSYAGKVQLINSIIFGMETYWCSGVLIPKEHLSPLGRMRLWNQGATFLEQSTSTEIVMATRAGGWGYMAPMDFMLSLGQADYLGRTVQTAKLMLQVCATGGKFFVSRAYHFFRNRGRPLGWANTLTGVGTIPSHRLLATMAGQFQLATIDNIKRRGISLANRCSLCINYNESHRHLFFKCPYSKSVWSALLGWMRIFGRSFHFLTELHWASKRRNAKHWKACWFRGCLAAAIYHIWQERNRRIFLGVHRDTDTLIRQIKYIVAIKCLSIVPGRNEETVINALNS
ncbi:hypothetical protein RND81_13G093400 [Saponaria officinalis]|uniref:Reverse transcriptase zinc-binding domain-containing protein n=1 Tax=Saponaria officinalis TaxID=3572 RepID=A0AAW1GVQ9_SAPOF